ncbi:MAG: DUF305 domain-containing protein [Microthrixaceae bacterium]
MVPADPPDVALPDTDGAPDAGAGTDDGDTAGATDGAVETPMEAGRGEQAAARAFDWVNRHGLALAAVLVVGVFAWVIGHRVGTGPQPAADSVDVGFLQDMYTHHDQAVEMGIIMASDATDPVVKSVAQEVVVQQRFEQGVMSAWLGDWGYDLGEQDRTAMAWMGTPKPVDRMDGLQSPEKMAELRETTGPAKDILFLEMMTDHHRGGVHMGDYAAARGEDARVRRQAEIMARNQGIEIGELEAIVTRLERDG